MADLRSEIEARKSRIAELRRKREVFASSLALGKETAQTSHKLSYSVPDNPQIEVDKPFLYEKQVQTDPLVGSVDNTSDLPVIAPKLSEQTENCAPKEDEKCAPTFTIKSPHHVPPSLLTFIDDFWRSVSRSTYEMRIRSIRNFKKTPETAKEIPEPLPSGEHALTLSRTIETAAKIVDFSPFHSGLIATLTKDLHRLSLWDMEAPNSPEYTLRSPTKLTNALFSPFNASFLFASGVNGQVFTWDLSSLKRSGGRFDLLPVLRSPIDSSECTCLSTLGTSIISLNEDGILRVWAADKLSKPVHQLVLEDALRPIMSAHKLSAIVPMSLVVWNPLGHLSSLGFGWKLAVVGTITGHLFRLPNSPSAHPVSQSWRHNAAVTCLSVQSPKKEDAMEVKMLSGGLDWCIRMWNVPLDEQIPPTIEKQVKIDYAVASVCWHPTVTHIFAAGGENCVRIYDTRKSKPLVELEIETCVKQVKFNPTFENLKQSEIHSSRMVTSADKDNEGSVNEHIQASGNNNDNVETSELAVVTDAGLYLYTFDKL